MAFFAPKAKLANSNDGSMKRSSERAFIKAVFRSLVTVESKVW